MDFSSSLVFRCDVAGDLVSLHDFTIFSIAPGVHECDRGEASILLNSLDRDSFLMRGVVTVGLLDLSVSDTSTCTPIFAESRSRRVLFASLLSVSNEGDATRCRRDFPQSESDAPALSASSSLLEVFKEAARRLTGFPASEPESSLTHEDAIFHLALLDTSDSDSLPSESSWPLSALDWESDLWNEGLGLSANEVSQQQNKSRVIKHYCRVNFSILTV